MYRATDLIRPSRPPIFLLFQGLQSKRGEGFPKGSNGESRALGVMARARSALWATLVGSLIGFVGGFLHAPSCRGRSAPAVRPRLLELAHPSCAVGGPVERHQRAGSPRTAFQRGMVLRAKSVDKNESDLPEDALGIVTPGGKVDVDPYVSRISTHANNEGKTEAEGRRKLRWRIFNRDYDKEIVSMAVPSYTAVLLDPIGRPSTLRSAARILETAPKFSQESAPAVP
jgi:hypothetical protein